MSWDACQFKQMCLQDVENIQEWNSDYQHRAVIYWCSIYMYQSFYFKNVTNMYIINTHCTSFICLKMKYIFILRDYIHFFDILIFVSCGLMRYSEIFQLYSDRT